MLTSNEMYIQYKAQSNRLLPELSYKKAVSEEQQKKEIDLLKETIHYERFFFVLNLHQMEIEKAHGVQKWLGYPDKTFTVQKLLQIIHPHHLAAHHISATVLIEGLMKGDWPVEFMKYRFASSVALQHANGTYLLCKRLNSVFQYDLPGRRLLEYISEFTIVGEYKEQPATARLVTENGDKLDWMAEVMQRLKDAFENRNLFGSQELRILRKYAYKPDLSTAELARSFKVKDSTIGTHNKRILDKAEQLFKIRFTTASKVAAFLREQGLI
ncbi:MAG TPA: hypothetical protein PLP23_06610 [Panacibacter sp.]|nr:hypothetical protein [Panacibacter sp.]